jgi:cleavage and polyadenylation specificity factor subunit 2
MFPVFETRNRIDDYGEVIDIAEFRKFETEKPAEVEMVFVKLIKEVDMPSKEDKVVAEVEIPVKYTVEDIFLQIRCKLQYIDFEGRSDSRSVKNVLQHVGPKRLVLSAKVSYLFADPRRALLLWRTFAGRNQ